MNAEKRKCKECGAEFEPQRRENQPYCSVRCGILGIRRSVRFNSQRYRIRRQTESLFQQLAQLQAALKEKLA